MGRLRLLISCCILLVSSKLFSVDAADDKTREEDTYDFIVVGGGTGGCVVAGRLAQSGKYSVLLIEQGGPPLPGQEVPAFQGRFLGSNPVTATVYQTIPQINAGRASNGVVNLIVGRGLGGSSQINGGYFNRGNPHDYNLWARWTRDSSWNYTNLLPYFKKLENYNGDYPSEQHGYDGPIVVSSPEYAPGQAEWLLAGRELGFENVDPNGPQKLSFTTVEFAKNFGRRVSAYNGYIEPLKNNRKLKILANTKATKILFDGIRATSVKYTTNNGTTVGYAHARNEIILSSGVIGTPVILMKSGIGPRQVLSRAKIPIIRNLPVGKNIHDQASIIVPVILNKTAIWDPATDLTDEALKIYNQYGDGPYSSTLGTAGQAFLPSSAIPLSERLRNWADVHLLAFSTPVISPAAIVPADKLRKGEAYASWTVVVGRPKSRGSITLNLTDIEGPPLLDFQYLNHPIDKQVVVDGAKYIAKICEETTGFQKLGCRLPGPISACSSFKYKSDRYWSCYAREHGRSGLHPAGGCMMGAGWDNLQATVDSQLRVIGIEGLRIGDASVMPAVVNSNTMVAVYAIGEKLADMLLQEYASKSHVPITIPKTRYLVRVKVPGL